MLGEPALQQFVVFREVDQVEVDATSGLGVPDAGALLDRIHRRQRLYAEFRVDPAARQVVEDVDLVAGVGEMERRGPADEAVAAENCYLHLSTPLVVGTDFLIGRICDRNAIFHMTAALPPRLSRLSTEA